MKIVKRFGHTLAEVARMFVIARECASLSRAGYYEQAKNLILRG